MRQAHHEKGRNTLNRPRPIRNLEKRFKSVGSRVVESVENHVHTALNMLGIPQKEAIDDMKRRVAQLKKKISNLH